MFTIVAGHFELFTITGGAYFLLLLAGFSFSRFQLPSVLSNDRATGILSLALRVYLPVLLISALQAIKVGAFDPLFFLPVRNLMPSAQGSFHFWFIDVYIQLQLMMALLLAWPQVRRATAVATWVHYLAWFALFWCLAKLVPGHFDAEHLYNRVPWMLGYLFALGMLIERTRTWEQRLVVSAVCLALLALPWALHGDNVAPTSTDRWWVACGALALVWGRTLTGPALLVAAVSALAMASLHVYLTHFLVANAMGRHLPDVPTWLGVMVALGFGVGFGRVWKWAERRVRARLPARQSRGDLPQAQLPLAQAQAEPATAHRPRKPTPDPKPAWQGSSLLPSEFGQGSRF